MSLLEVADLSVAYATKNSPPTHAVRNVSFSMAEGECVGLLGESGCGKSTLGTALLRLLDRPARITGGTIRFDGTDITALDENALRPLRWRALSTVFQSSMNSLNPVLTVEAQFRDMFRTHTDMTSGEIRRRTAELLEMVLIDPSYMRFHPHELSGGMKQRVALALALALRPKLVVLDEPTTGLDVVVQKSIMDSVRTLQREQGFAVLLISHDLGTVMEIADRVMVMYAGSVVESRPAGEMLHPYSRGLLGSYADPRAETVDVTYIPGRPPDLSRFQDGCLFVDRCPVALPKCATEKPPLAPVGDGLVACHVAPSTKADFADSTFVRSVRAVAEAPPVLEVTGVHKTYTRRRTSVTAVDDVSFALRRGRVTALVGQSGSGKSTIAKLLTGIERPDTGTVMFGDVPVHRLRGRAMRRYRKDVQLVFQDPFAALNPVRTVRQTLVRPLRNHLGLSEKDARARLESLVDTVGLAPAFLDRYPHQLSGGQRQRVVVARALAPEPSILIADEPISMLDVSIRAEIVELLDRLVHHRDLAMLYITHDLLSARLLADEVLVLNKGTVVEDGPTIEVIRNAQAPYTKLLLDALPNPPR
ncbi:ABC transporter ATP-binding protein [Actinophytocola algeriensis]|uniref:Peptide/nickel transport system ATP-binding protein n=1 Tax=Actinophytocola algeriensis TaxID=1768010 RepID=A0A7W7QB74_9PSEU|nr:ABC transporter ATP-binding protein [Actinophytocola algeriensis]MBB4909956.1 peptide/nickel transport system ATP-binding protein [Actinophytocola algeriensis]MBE1475946.1 peptide/nickel transport system ATP-binding protein [Actinophytocola algeriensis]